MIPPLLPFFDLMVILFYPYFFAVQS